MTPLKQSVQMETGDSDCDNGIMPGSKQVSDQMLQYAYEYEGVSDLVDSTTQEVKRVSAKVLEMAASAWDSEPIEAELGPSAEVNQTAANLRREAEKLRGRWGYGNPDEAAQKPTVGRSGKPAYVGLGMISFPPGVT